MYVISHILILTLSYNAIRNYDRMHNGTNLAFPELYLLKGGYKMFHESHPEICGGYVPMSQFDTKEEMAQFRADIASFSLRNSRGE